MNHFAFPRLRAVAFGLVLLPLLAKSALADGCTPVTSTASPVTNSTVTCTGVTINQNTALGFNIGYGTFNETGNTIDVQTTASVTGDSFGLGLADGNTVNNSGLVTGGSVGVVTTTGSTVTINNLTSSSTISGPTGEGFDVTNVVLSNAGTVTGQFDGILATGSVSLADNTGLITGTDSNSSGIKANTVSGNNAGTISGAVGIDTVTGSDVNLTSNSGTIQGNSSFAITTGGNVVIGANSGSIVGVGRAIDAGGSANVTNASAGTISATGVNSSAIIAVGDTVVVNSGNITATGVAINAQSNSSTSLDLTNNSGGTINADTAVEAVGSATIINGGTIMGAGQGVFVIGSTSITNTTSGVIEATGTSAEAIVGSALLLNNAGIVQVTATQFFAVDVDTIETGSSNSGTISGNAAAINANDSIDMTNSGTITGGILAIQATNTATLANSGTVSGDRLGIVANDVEITNSGTITASGGSGLQAIAIFTLTGNITNDVSGVISATGTAANNDAINTADITTVDNFGLISSAGRSGIRAGGNATIINETGGTITGVTGIQIRDAGDGFGAPVNSSVFNAGTITGTGGVAINFAVTAGAGPMTLTLAPGSVINGLVLGTGADTFQLGGKGTDTFNVDNIGPTQQYQGFTTFNKTGGSTWTLTGTGTQSWSILSGTLIGDTNTFGANISNNGTIEFVQDFDGTYANSISGTGDFIKGGTGTVTLTGASTYTGTTTISAGTLAISGAGGIANSSDVSVHATFDISGAAGGVSIQALEGDGSVVLGGNALTVSNANGNFSGVISGAGGFVLNSGVETLSGDNTYTGGTTINSGNLTIGTGGSTGSIAGDIVDNGALVFNRLGDFVFSGSISGTGEVAKLDPGTLTLTGSYSYSGETFIGSDVGTTLILAGGKNTLSGLIDDEGALVSEATSLTLSGSIIGGGSLSVVGGATTLSGNNSYGGGTTVANGTLSISSDGNLGGGDVALENGSTLQLTSTFVLTHAITVAGDPTFDVTGSNIVLVTATITDGAQPGDVVKTGTGVLTLGAVNTYTGGTFVNGGTLQLGDNGDHTSVVGSISAASGTNLLVVNADFSQVTTVTLDGANALFELSSNAKTAQIAVTNNGSVGFLENASAGQSQISVDGSIAAFQDSASLGSAAISAGNGSMVVFLGSSTAANGTIGISGPGSLVFFGSSTAANAQISASGSNPQIAFVQNSTAANATITFSQPGVLEFNDASSANQAHIVTTGSTVEFISSSTAANATIDASAGGSIFFFQISSANSAQITLGGNGTLNFSDNASGSSATVTAGQGTHLFISGLTNGGTSLASLNTAGNVVLGDNTLTIGSDNSNSTISGTISGLGGLTKLGTGTLTLTGKNFFSGVTTISGGTLQVGNGGATGNIGGDIVDNAALVFDLSGFVTVPGAISGKGTLAQIGSGTTILTGTDTYSGGTTITSGTLQIGNGNNTGSIAGNVVDNGTLAFAHADTVTFADVISGSGSLTQLGGGTLVLTGDNIYTGGTTIRGGVLQIGFRTDSGSIIGDVVDDGTLEFNRSTDTIFSGSITGTGGLIKLGPGELDLTGSFSYLGQTSISPGTSTLRLGGGINALNGAIIDDGALISDATALSLGGDISGNGSLTVESGTTTLTGTNTYVGGTTIAAGTLQLGTGGTTGSIIGDVVDNGTLLFDRSDTVTFPGAISGSGVVVQNGSGTLILTGTSSYSGTTTVNAGILDVNGSIATSAVTVNRSTTLKGNGTVGPLTLASGATVAPGNSIGTLHVAGNVSFAAGSVYNVELNPAGQSDLIAATGAATIAPGALVQITAASGTYAAQTDYVILTAAGGVTGTFATPTINLPFLEPELIYQPNEVDLLLKLRDINLIPPAHTPNEIATAVAVKAGGFQSVIFGQFLQDSVNGLGFVVSALDQLSGEIHPSLPTEEMEDSRLVQLSILSRLRQTTTGDASGMLAPAPAEAREIVDGVSMWTHALAEWGAFDTDGNVATLNQSLSGILAGIDARKGAANFGVAGGYSHSHADQRTSVAKGGNTYVAAYGGWVDGALALRVGATYGWGNRDIFRTVVFPGFSEALTSREDEHESQVFGEVAYAANIAPLALEPFAGIAWDDASTGSFTEKGGAAALSGNGGDDSIAQSSLGVRLATAPFGDDMLNVTPRASVAWQHGFGGLHPGQVLTFEDTGRSFFAFGSLIDADSADVAAGLDAHIGSSATLSLGYEGNLSSRVRLNTIHAGLNWTFQ